MSNETKLEMTENLTIFLSTRNRPSFINKALANIKEFCPYATTLVGNSSSDVYFKEVEDIINSYDRVRSIHYTPDPGLSIVYSDLFGQYVKTEFAMWWADDMLLTRPIDKLLKYFEYKKINLVAIPMIDDIKDAPVMIPGDGYEKDEHGCAWWKTPTGRCAHHAIIRVKYFKRYDKEGRVYPICGTGNPDDVIDNWCHNFTLPYHRIWPDDGAYAYHKRVDDDTRAYTVFSKDNFRKLPSYRKKFGEKLIFKTSSEREKYINEK